MDGDLNTMVQNILQNPEFTALVKEIKGDKSDNTEIDTEKIMSKLPEMLNMFGLQGNDKQNEESDRESSHQHNNEDDHPSEHSSNSKAETIPPGIAKLWKPGSKDKRNKLLCALKPYLSPARCSLIDKAMNAMQLGEVLGVMQSVQPGGTNDNQSG
ncbi:MAG: hypothetical protein IJ325_12440 [Clostridia bacterium]|nr:hypothetical protein [Clostridia bacterium]